MSANTVLGAKIEELECLKESQGASSVEYRVGGGRGGRGGVDASS